jgi:3-hydroxyacyl-CoA dehydrogenase
MSNNKPIRRVAIIGTGVIGASWTALFLAKGLEVVATDPAPNAEAALKRFVEAAWPALKRLGLAPGASQSKLTFTRDLPTAVKGADLVQENGPERIDFKKKLYGQLDELLPPDVVIASSSSGLTMSEIQSGCPSHPERCVIAHPFNPPHLVPLVEIVGGAKTSEQTIARVFELFKGLGKQAIRVRKEDQGTSPIVCRRRSRGRFITWLPRASSALPTSTARCAGDQACAGASWAT